MKQANLVFVLILFICAQVFYSCSSSSSFTKRKYFDFRQDKKEHARVAPAKPAPADYEMNSGVTVAEAEPVVPAPVAEKAFGEQTASRVKGTEAPVIGKSPASSVKEEKLSLGEQLVVKQAQKIAKKQQEKDSSRIETILLVILAILLPPLAVFLVEGLEVEFWISLLLTLLFFLPGVIYALYIVLTRT